MFFTRRDSDRRLRFFHPPREARSASSARASSRHSLTPNLSIPNRLPRTTSQTRIRTNERQSDAERVRFTRRGLAGFAAHGAARSRCSRGRRRVLRAQQRPEQQHLTLGRFGAPTPPGSRRGSRTRWRGRTACCPRSRAHTCSSATRRGPSRTTRSRWAGAAPRGAGAFGGLGNGSVGGGPGNGGLGAGSARSAGGSTRPSAEADGGPSARRCGRGHRRGDNRRRRREARANRAGAVGRARRARRARRAAGAGRRAERNGAGGSVAAAHVRLGDARAGCGGGEGRVLRGGGRRARKSASRSRRPSSPAASAAARPPRRFSRCSGRARRAPRALA